MDSRLKHFIKEHEPDIDLTPKKIDPVFKLVFC